MPKKTSDLKNNPFPSILIVGDSGSHKTHFAGGCPDPYLFNFDKGVAILRHNDVAEYDTFSDGPFGIAKTDKDEGIYPWGTAWEAFIKRLNEIGKQLDEGTCPYKTLALDSLTTMNDVCMNYVLKGDGKGQISPQVNHWGSQIQLMQKVISDLMAWPIIKVVTAHIQRNQNDLTQVTEMLPLVTGKLAGKIGLYFDEVYFTNTKTEANGQQKFTLTTTSTPLIKQAKSRWGVPNGTETSWTAIEPYVLGKK